MTFVHASLTLPHNPRLRPPRLGPPHLPHLLRQHPTVVRLAQLDQRRFSQRHLAKSRSVVCSRLLGVLCSLSAR